MLLITQHNITMNIKTKMPMVCSSTKQSTTTMRTSLLLLLLAALPAAHSSTPTTYIDIRRTTTLPVTDTLPFGGIEIDYLYRIPAAESNYAPSPPKAPKDADYHPLSNNLNHKTSNKSKSSSGSGSSISKNYPSYPVALPPSTDVYLCEESKGNLDYTAPLGNTDVIDRPLDNKYVLVERGHCTFEAKSRSAQRLGAKGIIVRNTLDSRYGLIESEEETTNGYLNANGAYPSYTHTKWPAPQRDYECGTHTSSTSTKQIGLRAIIPTSKLNFDPAPYDGTHNNVLLSGSMADGNLCAMEYALDYDIFRTKCPSERCLLTGQNASEDGSQLEACCAWDIPQRMSHDGEDGDAISEANEEEITIPSLFVTMMYGEELYQLVVDAEANNGISNSGNGGVQFISIVPYAKWYPSFHFSSLVVGALAVFTLWISCWISAKEYRSSWIKIAAAVNEGVLVFQSTNSSVANGDGRGRANTDDTMDLGDDLELELAAGSGVHDLGLQVEMTQRNENGTTEDVDAGVANGDAMEGKKSDEFVDDDVSSSDAASASDDASPTTDPENGEEVPPSSNIMDIAQNVDEIPVSSTTLALPEEQPQQQQQQQQQVNLRSNPSSVSEMNLELNAVHALIFVVAASLMLFVLFFFNLYKVVRVIYGLGGSAAMSQIIFHPVYHWASSKNDSFSKKFHSIAFGDLPGMRGVYFKWIEIASFVSSYGMGIAWIYLGLNLIDPLSNHYYWVVQDIMGVCYCILILGLVHINTLMVATILLVLIFFYDIFYVFLTPYIFGSSVMIDVATGGGGSVDADFCEKYPSDSACRGYKAPLPMMLAVPWISDYRGGASMIGLGDIIFPGLLISFAARFDAAKELVKRCSLTTAARSGALNGDNVETTETASEGANASSRYHYHIGRIQKALFKGYFGPLVFAYAIGLIAAYIAVYGMNQGQPALLYLVPSCLGTMLFLAWKRKQFAELWAGPKIMKKANRIMATARGIPAVREAAARDASNNLAETSSIA